MPELPEVETVRAGLAEHVLGRTVTDIEVLREYSVRRHLPGPMDFVGRLRGRRLDAAVRRGKFVWLLLDDGSALQAHLGMSGQLLVRSGAAGPDGAAGHAGDPGPTSADHPHLRVRLRLDDGGELRFVDQRTFGYLVVSELVPTPDGGPGGVGSPLPALPETVAHVARDLLDPVLDLDGLGAALRRRRTEVKRALLDQTLVSGVGNIYADEALWRAGLHHTRRTDVLRPAAARTLLDAGAQVMREALAAGGTSFDALYVDVTGASGYFERELAVYGREGLPCPRCGAPVRREPFMNRSSFSCPRCQPRPRAAGPRRD